MIQFEHLVDEVVQVELETGSTHAGVVVSAEGSYLKIYDGIRSWLLLKPEIVKIAKIQPVKFIM